MPRAAAQPQAPAAQQPQAPTVRATPRASVVVVACKVPNGLVLQLCKKTSFPEETPSGTRDRVRYDRVGPRVTVRGPAYPVGTPPAGMPPRPAIVGGYALTPNVDREFFEQWMEQNRQNPIVINRMIFAHEARSHVVGQARELKDTRSGFEPLIPDNDPRLPKPQTAGLTPIQRADEMNGRAALPDADSEYEDA